MPRWLGSRNGGLRLVVRLALVGLACVLLAVIVWPRPAPDRLTIGGQRFFLAGVNYPWKTGQDFGNGEWGHSGVSNPTTYAEVDADFANMASRGVRVVKWRVFSDGRYSPEFDDRGFPVGLDDDFFRDVDAALEIARRHDIYLIFVLFDSGFWATDCSSKGVQLGGHVDVLVDPAKRQALVDRVIVPFARHVGNDEQVIAYEVLAEPDWGVAELNTDDDGRQKVTLNQARALARSIVGGIRAHSRAMITLEANRSRNMQAWQGLGLDFYSFSWYDWMEPYDPLDQEAAGFGLDRPIVLGEFPVQSAAYDLSTVLEIALRRGYAGAFAWSFSGIDRYGTLVDQTSAYVGWLQRYWSLVNLRVPEPPPDEPSLIPPPYSVRDIQLGANDQGLLVKADLLLRERQPATVRLYATPIGQTEPVAGVTIPAAPDSSGLATIHVPLTTLSEGEPYTLSLGLFGDNGNLLKWFDGIARVEFRDGKVQTPDLPTLALENPCHS